VHRRIDQGFREAGITIAFPQQDLHIRSIEPPLPHPSASQAPGPASEPGAPPAHA
jgi:small-conductance mechanosensitive channel